MVSELSNGKITIRRYKDSDVEALFDAVSESIPELQPWMPWCNENYGLVDSGGWVLSRKQAWQDGDEYSFVITDAKADTFIGGVGLNLLREEKKVANLGYWVRTSHRGRGIAARAAILAAQLGFRELNLRRIEIIAAVGNTASQRAAEKAGAKREGTLRQGLIISDQTHDAILYSLLPQDLPQDALRSSK